MRLMHRERAMCDAIVVGAGTVRADNPSLTTRYWPGRNPLRVVLDRRLSMPLDSTLLTDGAPTVVYNEVKNDRQGSVDYVRLPSCSPDEWLKDLYSRGVTAVMVEGGGNVLAQMLETGLWDEIRREIAPRATHGGVPAPQLSFKPSIVEIVGKNTIEIYHH
jgi:diaminohydroxyphosphoribosylaminopyrimidine deaminase/5-amino-6-(5-phosphoribosylamino)uracil reductase